VQGTGSTHRLCEHALARAVLCASSMSSHTNHPGLFPPSLQAGARLGAKFVVRGLLGRGGTASVYEALQVDRGSTVAVKVCEPDAGYRGEARARLSREAAAYGRIDDARLPHVHEVGELEDGTPFMVMEMIRGRTLRAILDEEGAVPIEDACRLVMELLEVLERVHACGILHRDIKPSNLILEQDPDAAPRLRLIDFGICRKLRDPADATLITRCGEIVGTPTYMAPEQLTGMPVDARADVYATGALLFELLTGMPPHGRLSYGELIASVLRDESPSVSDFRPEVPRRIAEVVARAIEKSPKARFGSASEMRAALEEAVHTSSAGRVVARLPERKVLRRTEGDAATLPAQAVAPAARTPWFVPHGYLRRPVSRAVSAKSFVAAALFVVAQVLVPSRGPAQSSCDAPPYTIDALAGASQTLTEARAINMRHEVAGYSIGAGSISYAVRWSTPAGTPQILSPASSAGAFGISASGIVAGVISTGLGERAAIWTPGGRLRWLAPLRGHESSIAFAVNSSRIAVGASLSTNGDATAVAWYDRREPTTLPSDGAARSFALAINDEGQVVGQGEYAGVQRALLWNDRILTKLTGLGDNVDAAEAISSTGTYIAGTSLDPVTGQPHAVIWRDGIAEDLGRWLKMGSAAHGVNRHGLVVGEVNVQHDDTLAVLWTDGVPKRLHELTAPNGEWTLSSARAINDAGEIVGYGRRRGAPGIHAFVMRPVPTSLGPSAPCAQLASTSWVPLAAD
jgi:uncharacterized membrane protein/tRNA A-37 threonylcarbamoyl transferase component Bud32